jgi:hypothetical protein
MRLYISLLLTKEVVVVWLTIQSPWWIVVLAKIYMRRLLFVSVPPPLFHVTFAHKESPTPSHYRAQLRLHRFLTLLRSYLTIDWFFIIIIRRHGTTNMGGYTYTVVDILTTYFHIRGSSPIWSFVFGSESNLSYRLCGGLSQESDTFHTAPRWNMRS